MKGFIALACFIVAIQLSTFALGEDVLTLTTENFDETINNADIMLVEFYAPWCGHCKTLAPKYEEAAGILKKNDPPIQLGKVDATEHASLAQRYGVSGYPTLKVFRKGVASDYKGNRETSGIVSYMKKNVGESARTLKTIEDAKKFVSYAGDVSIVGVFPTKSAESDAFLKTADAMREEFRFGYITDQSIASALGVESGVVMFRSSEKDKTVAPKLPSYNDWVYDQAVEFPGEITKDNAQRYLRKNLPIVKLFTDVNWGSNLKQTTYYMNRLKKIAEDAFKGKLLFAIADKSAHSEDTAKFGLTKFPAIAIDDHSNSQKYRHAEDFSVEGAVKFVKEFLEGKLKSYIKSEPTPDQTGPVTIVTGENFKDTVLDTTKDVLLEMYAPWCGHCKKLTPIYDELAENLKNVENVVIAKMDATANDSPHGKYQAKGYPTILFAPANSKDEPIAYSGARDVASFTDFLKKNSNSWKVNEAKSEL